MRDKVFCTYQQQRQRLEERGLIIAHPRFFTNCMQRDDYYSIINGHKKYFLSGTSPERYFKGTTFEQLYALYTFDRTICLLFLDESIKIEKHIKSLIAYHFSEQHGYDHRLYLDVNNFKHASLDNRKYATNLISRLENDIRRNAAQGNESICHYLEHYGYIPLWVLNNVLTFGRIAHFYSCMKLNEQQAVAKHFRMSAGELDGFIYFLGSLRNACAHGSRIYTSNTAKKFQKIIPDTKIHASLDIPKNSTGNYIAGKSDVLAMLITLKYFSRKSDFNAIKKKFCKAYHEMESMIPPSILENIHQEMGCPMLYLPML